MPNLWAVDGPRSASLLHTPAKTGASTMMMSGLTDWKNAGSIVHPRNDRSVLSSANADNELAACSLIIQKSIAATNSGMYARTRLRSGAVTFAERSITMK